MTQEMNPYRPPSADVELAPDSALAPEIASKWRRFLTLLLDYVGFMVLSLIVGLLLGFFLHEQAQVVFQGGWSYVYSFSIMIGYYLFFEGLWGQTPGKMILGTIVTDMKGQPPTFGAVVGRTLARFVPFEPFTFFGERGFHDKVSRTRVVRSR